MTWVGSLLGALGTGVSAFFGFKQHQAETVSEALKVVGDVNTSNAQREQAIATIIAAESTSGYWLAAVWRPFTMMVFLGLIVSFWFGYVPPNFDQPMGPMMDRIFDLLTIGIGGYIPARTIEKIVHNINVGKILKTYIEKKVL